MKKIISLIALLFCLPSWATNGNLNQEADDHLKKSDNLQTLSKQNDEGSFAVIPIPFTNPTLGYGIQLIGLYMHPTEAGASHSATSGIGAMVSENESWLVGAFHDGSTANEKWKYTAFAGVGEFHLKFYGLGAEGDNYRHPINYDIKPAIIQGEATRKISEGHWYAGGKVLLVRADSSVKNIGSIEIPDFYQEKLSINGAGLIGVYDTRDNNYFPVEGMKLELELMQFMPALDNDHDYHSLIIDYRYYFQPLNSISFAAQAKYEQASDGTPFFQIPVLSLRGSEFGQFQNYVTVLTNIEARWSLVERWKLIGFIDSGTIADDFSTIGNTDYFKSYGAGIRYQVTEDKKLNFSADVAILEGDASLILRVGESF